MIKVSHEKFVNVSSRKVIVESISVLSFNRSNLFSKTLSDVNLVCLSASNLSDGEFEHAARKKKTVHVKNRLKIFVALEWCITHYMRDKYTVYPPFFMNKHKLVSLSFVTNKHPILCTFCKKPHPFCFAN